MTVAETTEILAYKLDIADVEAKARRILALQEQIKAAQAAGNDTTDLAQRLDAEVNGLGRLGSESRRTSDEIERLLKSKRDLAGVVQLLGGRFSGMIGDIGDVVEIMRSGSGVVQGFAAALGALAVGQAIFAELTRRAKEAQEAIDRVADAQARMRDEGVDLRAKIAQQALPLGITGVGASGDAFVRDLGTQGVPLDLAIQALLAKTLAQSGGQGFDTQQFLRGAVASGGKVDLSQPGEVQRVLAAGDQPGSAAALRGYLGDVGERARREAPSATAVEGPVAAEIIDRLVAQLKAQGVYSEKDLSVIGRLAGDPAALARAQAGLAEARSEVDANLLSNLLEKIGLFGPSTEERLSDTAAILRREAGLEGREAVNITVTNIGTVVGGRGNPMHDPLSRPYPGSGIAERR